MGVTYDAILGQLRTTDAPGGATGQMQYNNGGAFAGLPNLITDGTNLTIGDGANVVLGTTTGTKWGTSTVQKQGWFNATPVAQQANSTDIGTSTSNLGFRAVGANWAASTSGTVNLTGSVALGTSGLRSNMVSRTGAASLTATSALVELCDATTAAFALTLPAASASAGQFFMIKKVDSSANAVTITAAGSDTIDGTTTYVLRKQYSAAILVNNATTNWSVFGIGGRAGGTWALTNATPNFTYDPTTSTGAQDKVAIATIIGVLQNLSAG